MQVQLLKNSQTNAAFGFLIVGFALPLYFLLLSGFPTADALKVCAMILVQIISGALIWAQVMHPRQVDIVEGVGMGLAIGSIFAVIGHQIFLPTSLRDFGWLLPVLIAAITSLTWRSTKGSHKNFVLEDVSGLFFVAFAVVLILKQWWWLLPLALPTGLALYLLSNSGHNKLRNILKPTWIFVTVSFVGVTVLMVYLRQLNLDWWIRSWDLQFFESRSYSIAKFGRNENISLVGYPIQYHWFGLAWLGSITVITDLGPWLATAQIAPAYSAIAIGCLIIAIAKRTSSNQLTKYAILLALAFASGAFSPANPPNIISLIWLFSAIVTADEFFKNHKFRVFAALAVIAVATFSGKVSAGYTVLAATALTDFWLCIKHKERIKDSLLRILFLLTLTTLAFFVVIGGPNRLGQNFIKLGFKGPGEIFGVEPGRRDLIYVAGYFGFVVQLLPICLALILSLIKKGQKLSTLIYCGFGLFALIIPSFAIQENFGYFVASARVFAITGCAIALTTGFWPEFLKLNSRKVTATIILFALMLGLVSQQIFDKAKMYTTNFKGGSTPYIFSVLIFTLLIYWLVFPQLISIKSRATPKPSLSFRFNLFAATLFLGTILSPVYSHLKSLQDKLAIEKSDIPYIGDKDVEQASQWLGMSADYSEIVATNRFCIEESVKTCIDPRYYAVSSTTRLRLLIEGPFSVVGYGGDDESLYPKFAKERLNLSRGFADEPTAEIAARLRELGVDWFYLFLDNTENRNWAPFATVEYQNSEVAILKLIDPSS